MSPTRRGAGRTHSGSSEDEPLDRGEAAFTGAAAYYGRYRRGYPAELIARLRRFNRGGTGRLLDLGCGTGQFLLELAGSFADCIGVDPDQDMLREATRLAHARSVANARWIEAGSRDLSRLKADLGRFDLVTIGTAFHFMKPRATLTALKQIIAPGGGVVVAYSGSPMWLHSDPWAKALRAALESRLGPLRDLDVAAEGVRVCETTMRDLGYVHVERWEHTYQDTIDIDFIVGHILSASSLDQIPLRERPLLSEHLREAIAEAAPSHRVTETVVVRAKIGRAS